MKRVMLTTLSLVVLTGCATTPTKVPGSPEPAGALATTGPVETKPGPTGTPPATEPASTEGAGSGSETSGTGDIRDTVWANVTLNNFQCNGEPNAKFVNGVCGDGASSCSMEPGNPAYGDIVGPVGEDAVLVLECGDDGHFSVMVPVRAGADGKSREAMGEIRADQGSGWKGVRIEGKDIVAMLQDRKDFSAEDRRYRHVSGKSWKRV